MNTRNDWENLLRIYNEDLEKTGYSIKITDYYNDGCYTFPLWSMPRTITRTS